MQGFSVVAVVLALVACAPVGPDHEVPVVQMPASFSTAGVKWKRHSPESAPAAREWWKLFRDPTLNGLVERSVERNQEIAAASARVRQAREISNQARSMYFPAIDMGARAERSKYRFRGSRDGALLQNDFGIPVDLRYEVDLWGKVRRSVESAEASQQANEELLNALKLTIAGEVAQTYWALRAVDADREILNRTLEARRRALDLLGRRRDVGTISGLDLARAETEVATAEADRIRLDRTRVELVNALAVLAGEPATSSGIPERGDLPGPPSIPVSVPSDLLRQRPDIRAAERRVAAANADIGVATAAYFPSLVISASSGLDATSVGDLFNASALVWSIGASALTPLTNLKFLQAQRAEVVAYHEQVSAEYRQTVLEAIREVENALQGVAILERRQAAQERAVDAARRTFELSSKRFQGGLVSFLDVVDAERTRLETEQEANAIRGERLAVAVALAKAVGGSW